jgi:hypothetical protein
MFNSSLVADEAILKGHIGAVPGTFAPEMWVSAAGQER